MNEILVVDDDPDILDATQRALKNRYNVTAVEEPEAALTLLKQNPDRFDVILLDWKLKCPIDGDMVLDLIRFKYPGFKTPIIFVTAHTHIASKYLLKIGAYETLRKPVTKEHLIDAIERALGQRPPEDPHRKAPADLTWQELRKHELSRKIVTAIRVHGSLADAARDLDCSLMSLHRWLRLTGMHSFLIEKERQPKGNHSIGHTKNQT